MRSIFFHPKRTGEVINDVINSPENKSHIPDAHTLTEWEEAESRCQLTAILEQIESDGAEYLEYLDEYIQDYQERHLGTVKRVRRLLCIDWTPVQSIPVKVR